MNKLRFGIAAITLLSFPALSWDEIVNINGDIRKLTSSTSCNPSQWKDTKDACTCCLVKHGLKEEAPDKILKGCTNYCNENTLVDLEKEHKQKRAGGLVREMVATAVVAKDLSAPGLPALFSENDALDFLKTAQAKGLMEGDNLDCAKIKKNEDIKSGYATQIFYVSLSPNQTCSANDYELKYILKGSKAPLMEIKNLEVLKNSAVLNHGIEGLVITKHKFAGSYLVGKKRHYLVLLEAAHGEEMRSMVDKAAARLREVNGNTNDENYQALLTKVEQANRRLGEVMGKFNIKYQDKNCVDVLCKTTTHGDLHYENAFYSAKENTIYLIDNETMAESIVKKADPANDLTRVYYHSAARLKPSLRFPSNMSDEVLAEKTLKPFLEGYISAYDVNQRKRVKEKLRQILLQNAARILVTYGLSKPQAYDPIKLSKLQKLYVERIIQGLPEE